MLPNGLESSYPAEAGGLPPVLMHTRGPGARLCGPARRVSFRELLDPAEVRSVLAEQRASLSTRSLEPQGNRAFGHE